MPQVNITMSTSTMTGLLSSGSLLYAFRGVESSDLAARPLVWRQIQYSNLTTVVWQDLYEAYTSTDPIVANAAINPGFSVAVALGQTLNVTAGGAGTVVAGGPAGDVSILNTTQTQLTCGLSQAGPAGSSALPYCAFPLFGSNLQQITPNEKVLLMFSTQSLPPGTVIGTAPRAPLDALLASFSPSVLIDLTGAVERDVTYDLNAGWSWGGFTWAQRIPAGADFVPWLIAPVS
ncbi:MAG TPA: hypothetical protein VI669_09420 [Vicinamibacteria bacterium]